MIHLNKVCKEYRRGDQTVHALRPTTVDVARGDFVAVVGPSGSGKSTLLSMVGGMLAPTSGQIMLDDVSVYEQPIPKRCRMRNQKIGFVFQSFNLVPWLTAVENVQLPLSLYGAHDEHRGQAEELLSRFGLADRMHHKPLELSAGQQQRVALARTLVTDPQLILADEPTGNLDPVSRDMVLDTLATLRDEGRAIILVTHDATVSDAADRVLRITDGVVSEAPRPGRTGTLCRQAG